MSPLLRFLFLGDLAGEFAMDIAGDLCSSVEAGLLGLPDFLLTTMLEPLAVGAGFNAPRTFSSPPLPLDLKQKIEVSTILGTTEEGFSKPLVPHRLLSRIRPAVSTASEILRSITRADRCAAAPAGTAHCWM